MIVLNIVKIILSSVLSVAALFIIAKIMGHKQVAQLDFFDYVSGITVGSIAAELATELEKPLRPLIALIVYCLVSVILNKISRNITKSRKYINGTPTIIMDNGKIYRDNLRKSKLDLSEFMILCRELGYFDLSEIQTAVFEYNGKLSVLPKEKDRPLTASDIKLELKPKPFETELIMDGCIMKSNLDRMGLDVKWLRGQLKVQGYNSAKEILLAVCDDEKNLTIYPIE